MKTIQFLPPSASLILQSRFEAWCSGIKEADAAELAENVPPVDVLMVSLVSP